MVLLISLVQLVVLEREKDFSEGMEQRFVEKAVMSFFVEINITHNFIGTKNENH